MRRIDTRLEPQIRRLCTACGGRDEVEDAGGEVDGADGVAGLHGVVAPVGLFEHVAGVGDVVDRALNGRGIILCIVWDGGHSAGWSESRIGYNDGDGSKQLPLLQ